MDPCEQLIGEEEGRRATVYTDSRGFSTIGIGCLVDARIRGAGLCDEAIDAQFRHDSATAWASAGRIPNFSSLNTFQQAALVSICFQLGPQVLGWKHFMAAMTANDLNAAGAALLDTEWARTQTPGRAQREVKMLVSGAWVPHGG